MACLKTRRMPVEVSSRAAAARSTVFGKRGLTVRAVLLRLALFVVVAAGCCGGHAGQALAYPPAKCPDDGGALPRDCTKEIQVWNNTSGPIWIVLQGSIQLTDALNCPVTPTPGSGGDVWLQAALGNPNKCFAVTKDYYIYINPIAGIPKGGFASVNMPWWSKTKPGAPDLYIDWWRAGRVLIFDDRTALLDSYGKLAGKVPRVDFAAGSPVPSCNRQATGNACNALSIFAATPDATIAKHSPFQLNEYTFADVAAVSKGGEFIDFNQNYNVSNVDQAYLPVAMEPVRAPADIGYMGTTMSVDKFRQQLTGFIGNLSDPVWPIYNNPVVGGRPKYPNAGIRVPSAQTVLSYYMNPGTFPDGSTPEIIPKTPPKLLRQLMTQWTNCTAPTPRNCPRRELEVYSEISSTFLDNYQSYVNSCDKIPDFLKPLRGTDPKSPKLTALLTFVYGWVPFNVSCSNKELPTANDNPPGSRVPIDYIHVQYNYEDLSLDANQWFNPYTQLIHGDIAAGGLDANAYAFSIDDHSSFLSNSGGSLPGGLIFAVGGDNGLPNKTQVPPPAPPFYKWYDFSVNLGPNQAGGASWEKYGVCSDTADTLFQPSTDGTYVIGIDPAITKISNQNPCKITLKDSKGRKYQLVVLRAQAPGTQIPQKPIWPPFEPTAGKNFDPDVMACPAVDGFVPPDKWCDFTNQVSNPTKTPPPGQYSISTRSPLL